MDTLSLSSGSPRQRQGSQIEAAVCRYLIQQQHRILWQNYRCRFGEIDIISQTTPHALSTHTGTHRTDLLLVMTEVRFRKSDAFGGAEASVTRAKQQKLLRSARYFLQTHPQFQQHAVRFDVIGVKPAEGRYTINWIRNAFEES